jgi:hypothetical protein
MDAGVILTAVLVLLEQEISDQQCEGIAEAPGEGTFPCAYPYHAEWVYVNPLSMKSFHGVWAGNIHKCLPKTSVGKVSRKRFNNQQTACRPRPPSRMTPY